MQRKRSATIKDGVRIRVRKVQQGRSDTAFTHPRRKDTEVPEPLMNELEAVFGVGRPRR